MGLISVSLGIINIIKVTFVTFVLNIKEYAEILTARFSLISIYS